MWINFWYAGKILEAPVLMFTFVALFALHVASHYFTVSLAIFHCCDMF
jgi:hypothetical protein